MFGNNKLKELFILRCATSDSQTTILTLQRVTKLIVLDWNKDPAVI